MDIQKKEIVSTLNSSVKDLQERMDLHCCLVSSILENQLDERHIQSFFDRCPKRSRETALEDAIKHAIDVLEDTKKAFKSKKLEHLRKDLTRALIEAG
jgi:hypothetical protein